MFLGVIIKEYIEEPAVEGSPAVPAVEDEDGNVIQEAIPEIEARPAVIGTKVGRIYLENSAEQVARNLADEKPIEYYEIKSSVGSCSINKVKLKAERKTAPAREIVEIQVGSKTIGSAEV